MGPEVLIVALIFASIFGVFYLFFSTRNKERLALIEKGLDAGIFVKGKQDKAAPIWKILTLNFSLLVIGIGLGILLGNIFINMGLDEAVAVGTTFITAGTALLIGFFMVKKMDKEEL
ncbi:DUF6249 domain-containing protein [Cellulophaga fucicola]|uniref:DUF6249 domain-containing protein n=1 Tax=Cellulophaga fucicola TaxID=76595 RepID=A0A1K1R6U8_9FLAO|nr:DUF6249 domain-containing protein [Cellulophaga fucicola]SFW67350.1 hypothetical protein SAMN05660313_03305 [Cellulophaga fucicola]